MSQKLTDEEVETRKAKALAQWEADWEAMDFSWEGLADAGWHLGDLASEAQKLKRWMAPAGFPGEGNVHKISYGDWKEATIQDYWRWSIGIADGEERLLSDDALLARGLLKTGADGKLWHIIHLAETEASSHPALRRALLARLETANNEPLNIFADQKFKLNLKGSRTEKIFDFFSIQLTNRILLDMDFDFGKTSILNMNFSHPDIKYYFNKYKFKIVSVSFSKFKKIFKFMNSLVIEEIRIHDTNFKNYAYFEKSSFYDLFKINNSLLEKSAIFRKNEFFGNFQIKNTSFGENCQFIDNFFYKDVSIIKCTFSRGLSFSKSYFEDIPSGTSIFYSDVDFTGSEFGDDANFDHVIFKGNVRFDGCRFGKNVTFRSAVFHQKASFHEATFDDRASFKEAEFKGKTTFEGAEFIGAAFFRDCKLPQSPMESLNCFRATRFRELVSFRDVEISSLATFNEARFAKSLILHDPGEDRATELWDEALHAVKGEVKGEDKAREAYFGALEGGCRVLKQEMEKIADSSRERRYFRYELIARRHRPAIKRMERYRAMFIGP
ncbi:hypothetical protein JCM17846_10850 [Iodidimonas nitroreducens]|uniref:Pentapeptide repeat-containing protein n=1 Tax=Iodidimonas nitroreducens TaxID=1236968 RepID=A0A5A7N528_9PROT|nr:pentapeptide repeat-containing protein [Iodidimonas nitroreducens]GER03403.1 hypothetical protein JCM17846_10850 [Iodidimonas nitroreducens]